MKPIVSGANATSNGSRDNYALDRWLGGVSLSAYVRTPLDPDTTVVSVLIPVYNERSTLAEVVARVRSCPYHTEIVVVDDCSTDGTSAIADSLLERGQIDRLLHQPINRGKGAAIRAALAMSTGAIVIVQDADLEYDPEDWPGLFEPIVSGRADACFGSRFLGGAHRVLYFWHSIGNRVLTTISNMLTNINVSDMETCYKAMRGDLARALVSTLTADRFGFEPEITARLAQAGARIYEVPVSYSGRTYAEGKKINWRDGVAAFWHVARSNLFDARPDPGLATSLAAPHAVRTTPRVAAERALGARTRTVGTDHPVELVVARDVRGNPEAGVVFPVSQGDGGIQPLA